MSAAPDYIVGVDLGGTNIVSLLMTGKGEIVGRDTRSTLAKEGKDKSLSQIVNSVKRILEESEAKLGISSEFIIGLGIGSPGPLSIKKG